MAAMLHGFFSRNARSLIVNRLVFWIYRIHIYIIIQFGSKIVYFIKFLTINKACQKGMDTLVWNIEFGFPRFPWKAVQLSFDVHRKMSASGTSAASQGGSLHNPIYCCECSEENGRLTAISRHIHCPCEVCEGRPVNRMTAWRHA